ncbi:MAG TPA: type II toxin-antitoxin system Phd/YefM family antitoxin [Phycisphaerae bacterium]
MSASKARSRLQGLVDQIGDGHVRIVGTHGTAILVSEDRWNAIQETLYLLSMPRMLNSIRKGLATPMNDCKSELRW